MFKQIVVPLDGSERAEMAIPVAAKLARASGGSLILLRVVSLPVEFGEYVEPPAAMLAALEAGRAHAQAYLERAARRGDLQGVTMRLEALEGPVGTTILDAVEEFDADIIVMCSHGRTGLTRWALGSVAQKVARHASVPVLVLHDGGPSALPTAGRQVRALVALDGSELAMHALEPAARLVAGLSAPLPGTLHLVRVVQPQEEGEPRAAGVSGGTETAGTGNTLQRITEQLQGVAAQIQQLPLAGLPLDVSTHVARAADVAHTLVMLVENGDQPGGAPPDETRILAMATHGRSGVQLWTVGSVTDRVLHTTKVPMLIVRPADSASDRTAFPPGVASDLSDEAKNWPGMG